MRRYVLLILFALVLFLPFVMRRAVTPGPGSDRPARGASAGPRLVVITPHNQDIRREFGRAFSDWHQRTHGLPVDVDFRSPGGTIDIKRQLDTTYRIFRGPDGKIPDLVSAEIDIVWGGGDFFFNSELRELGVLQPMPLDPRLLAAAFPEATLAGVKLYDTATKDVAGNPTPTWVGVCLSSFGIVYNPDFYQKLRLPHPKTWHDLTDPRLAGLLSLADPTHSGSAGVAYLMVVQRCMADAEEAYLRTLPPGADGKPPALTAELKKAPAYQQALDEGWKAGMAELVKLAANARYFTDSAPLVPNDVGNGEAAAGMAIDFYGRVYEETVGPQRMRFVSPERATAITPDPVAVLKGVKDEQRMLALRFVEFLLSPEGQRLWILKPGAPGGPKDRALRRPPVRMDVYADRTGWTDETNPFKEAGGFNQRGEWMGQFSDLRPLWAAAWIDSRDALKDAYAAVLAVADESRRAALIAELANLPITRGQVDDLKKQRETLEKGAKEATAGARPVDVDEWKARQRIEWAKRFRQHYRAVEAKAEEARD